MHGLFHPRRMRSSMASVRRKLWQMSVVLRARVKSRRAGEKKEHVLPVFLSSSDHIVVGLSSEMLKQVCGSS